MNNRIEAFQWTSWKRSRHKTISTARLERPVPPVQTNFCFYWNFNSLERMKRVRWKGRKSEEEKDDSVQDRWYSRKCRFSDRSQGLDRYIETLRFWICKTRLGTSARLLLNTSNQTHQSHGLRLKVNEKVGWSPRVQPTQVKTCLWWAHVTHPIVWMDLNKLIKPIENVKEELFAVVVLLFCCCFVSNIKS